MLFNPSTKAFTGPAHTSRRPRLGIDIWRGRNVSRRSAYPFIHQVSQSVR